MRLGATLVPMERRPRNPVRRNRNIGTAKSGYGRDNRLTIPERWDSFRSFYEALKSPVRVTRSVHKWQVTFLVEAPQPGFGHACTVDDIARILRWIDEPSLSHIEVIVLRQPTRKQRILDGAWGRLRYFSSIDNRFCPVIFLEAQPLEGRRDWGSVSLGPEEAAELERIRSDGHTVIRSANRYQLESRTRADRQTQLYRTVLHEVGHWVDYDTWLTRNASDPELWNDDERDSYFSRPAREREGFAHRYADELGERLRNQCRIPFEPQGRSADLIAEGLDPCWFPNLSDRTDSNDLDR